MVCLWSTALTSKHHSNIHYIVRLQNPHWLLCLFYPSSCQLSVATVATAQHLTRSERVNQSLQLFLGHFVPVFWDTLYLYFKTLCTCIVQATLTSSPTVHSTKGSSEGNALPRSPGRRCYCFTFVWSWCWSLLTACWKGHPALREGWTCTLPRIHLL